METIAIDFGYSAIRVGIFNDFSEDEVSKAEVLPNDLGDRSTPTVIAIDDETRLVGVDAITHSALVPHNAVYGIKRIIGRSESDKVFQEHRKRHFFQHKVDNQRLKCLFIKNLGQKREKFFPDSSVLKSDTIVCSNTKNVATEEERTFEELLAFIFHKVKENAEQELQAITAEPQTVKRAVISVPAYFNHFQREAVINAAKIVDLVDIRLINDTTAAATNYVWDILDGENKKLVILDFGASSLEISLMEINGFEIEVLSTVGTTSLGGVDFDHNLMQMCVENFIRERKHDIKKDNRMLHKLRIECEKAKKTLQQKRDARIKIDLPNGTELVTVITRKDFDERCKHLYESVIRFVERVFDDTKVSKSDVNDIVLVGGSSRLKKIEDDLNTAGWKINKRLNVDEAVARGAAIFAYSLTTKNEKKIKIREVTPYRYGFTTSVIKEEKNEFDAINDTKNEAKKPDSVTVIIDRNAALPVSGSCLLSIRYPKDDNKEIESNINGPYSVGRGMRFGNNIQLNTKKRNAIARPCKINVVIGDTSNVFACTDLLKFKVTHAWKKVQNLLLNVTLSIDVNGICEFNAKHFIESKDHHDCNFKLEVKPLNSGLDNEEIKAIKAALKSYNDNYIKLENERIFRKNELQNELFELKQVIKHSVNLMESSELDHYREEINKCSNWVDQNSKVTTEILNEQRRVAKSIKIEIETRKSDYKMKVKENFDKFQSSLRTLNNEIKTAKEMFDSENFNCIEEEALKINQWCLVQQNRTLNEIDEKQSQTRQISTTLMEQIETELKLQRGIKEDAEEYIRNLREFSPFSAFEHLEDFSQYNDNLNAKLDELSRTISSAQFLKLNRLKSTQQQINDLVTEAIVQLENAEMIRVKTKVEVSDVITKLELLLNDTAKKTELTQAIAHRIQQIINDGQKWLQDNEYASRNDYIIYGKEIFSKYNFVMIEIDRENRRRSKLNELYNAALGVRQACGGINESTLTPPEHNYLVTSALDVIDWCDKNKSASIELISGKMKFVEELKKRRKSMTTNLEQQKENDVNKVDNAFVGIDFGTSYCCLAVFEKSEWKVIKLENECERMPSYVTFTDSGILVGSEAKTNMFENLANTIYNFKRLFGGKRTDPKFHNELDNLSYSVDRTMERLKVKVSRSENNTKTVKLFSPEQIAAMLMIKIKFKAEEHLGKEIETATISVPTMFSNAQRQATIDAARIAGFTNIKLLNDTIAVTLKHVLEENNKALSLSKIANNCFNAPKTSIEIKARKVLVVSIGAGYTSLSLIDVRSNHIQVLNHRGLDFGGEEFNKNIYNMVENETRRKFEGVHKIEVLSACESRKMTLQENKCEPIIVKKIYDNVNLELPVYIMSSDFNAICNNTFASICNEIENLISDITIDKKEISEILLVGESSKLTKIKSFFLDNLPKAIVHEFDDASIAVGCSIFAAISLNKIFRRLVITDVCSYGYTAECKRGEDVVIEKLTILPANATTVFKSSGNYADIIPTKIYEVIGDKRRLIFDDYLKSSPILKNKLNFKLSLDVDPNGILSISQIKADGSITQIYVKSCWSEKELKSMIEIGEKHRQLILKKSFLAKERKLLIDCIAKAEQQLKDIDNFCDKRDVNQANDALKAARHVLHQESSNEDVFRTRRVYIENMFQRILSTLQK